MTSGPVPFSCNRPLQISSCSAHQSLAEISCQQQWGGTAELLNPAVNSHPALRALLLALIIICVPQWLAPKKGPHGNIQLYVQLDCMGEFIAEIQKITIQHKVIHRLKLYILNLVSVYDVTGCKSKANPAQTLRTKVLILLLFFSTVNAYRSTIQIQFSHQPASALKKDGCEKRSSYNPTLVQRPIQVSLLADAGHD